MRLQDKMAVIFRRFMPLINTFKSYRIFCRIACRFLVISSILSSQVVYSQISANEIQKLDQLYNSLSNEIYRHLAEVNSQSMNDTSFEHLAAEVENRIRQAQHVEAITLIVGNLELIETNIDSDFSHQFVELLLKHNEWQTAASLYQTAQTKANDYTLAKLEYSFAKYYFERQQWDKSIDLFYKVIQSNALSDQQSHYALVTIGVLLQSNKQHRDALKYYESIPKDSEFYYVAQLNAALINIRQGWWTDAHIILENLLADTTVTENKKLTDRLHVILGYSMLRNEFYRNSREQFRNVRLNGEYANRALLGLALSAANQGDHIGALNALKILKEKDAVDLYVDESHLLLPYVYEQLKQDITASAGYTDAIAYYQQRITDLSVDKMDPVETITRSYGDGSKSQIIIGKQAFEYSEFYPKYFFENLFELDAMAKTVSNRTLREKIQTLKEQYDTMFVTMTAEVIDRYIYYLNSYLNQSRYGLAKLYDDKE